MSVVQLRVDFPYVDKDGKYLGVLSQVFDFPEDAAYVTGFEIIAYMPHGKGSIVAPIVKMPFSIHDDSGRYHTICRRIPDPTIDEYPV